MYLAKAVPTTFLVTGLSTYTESSSVGLTTMLRLYAAISRTEIMSSDLSQPMKLWLEESQKRVRVKKQSKCKRKRGSGDMKKSGGKRRRNEDEKTGGQKS